MISQVRNRATPYQCLRNMASKASGIAKGGIRAWLMPELNDIKVSLAEIRGEIKTTNERIESLNSKIESADRRITSQIQEMDKRLTAEIQGVKDSLNIVQRLSVLEAKVSSKA